MPSANSIGDPFIELQEVESTNNYAMGLIHAGMARHGTVVFAHEQTKGKGQRQKEWLSAPGKNITLSIIVKPFGLKLNEAFLLSMSTAVGVQRFCSKYADKELKIKWPNDIYWRDRKAGGILIENVITGQEWRYAVIGVGLNINQTDFGAFKKPVSLQLITGKSYDIIQLAKELVNFLETSFNELMASAKVTISEYHHHLYKWKEKVHLKNNNRNIEAIVKGVHISGKLIVQHEKEEMFSVGEIEWIN